MLDINDCLTDRAAIEDKLPLYNLDIRDGVAIAIYGLSESMHDLGSLDANLFKLLQNESGYVGMDYTLEDTYDVTLHILSIINDVLPIVNTLKLHHPIKHLTVNEWLGDVVIISIETEIEYNAICSTFTHDGSVSPTSQQSVFNFPNYYSHA